MARINNTVCATKEWWDATELFANKHGMNRSKFIVHAMAWFMENFRDDVAVLHAKPNDILRRWMMEG